MTRRPSLPVSAPRAGLATLVVASLALVSSVGFSSRLSAQDAGRTTVSGAITRRLQHMEPGTGSAGATIIVSTDQNTMPYITPVRLGVGALRVGFETVAEFETSLQGNFSVPAKLPDWVTTDRSIRFVLFDFYFNPIAMSDAFYVTDANGQLQRQGKVSAGSKEGGLMLSDRDGDLYVLAGATTNLKVGDNVYVQAKIGPQGECGAQPTLQVLESRVLPQ